MGIWILRFPPEFDIHTEPVSRAICRSLAAALGSLSLAAAAAAAAAADDSIEQWTVLTLRYDFNEQWGVALQQRVRFDQDVTRVKDYKVRPTLVWRPRKPLTVLAGYAYVAPVEKTSGWEQRAFLFGEYRLDLGELALKSRIGSTTRWIEDVDGAVWRFRYRLRATHPIGSWGPTSWYGALHDEVFVNMNDRGSGPVDGFEQNRLRAAPGLRFGGRYRAEFGYEWQYSLSRNEPPLRKHVFFLEMSIDLD